MAIPFSQLRFARTDGERVWGIDVLRFRPRTASTRISNNPLDRGTNCYLCQFEQIHGLAGVEPGRNLEVVPSLTTGRTDRQPDPLVDSLEKGDVETEAGLNVRWAMTQDLTANLALNPDFSQIEADVPQLDINSQFALSYPESRPFFLEGADYFVTPMRAVFTRTVADPDVGAKFTGQVNNNTVGLFAAKDAITNLLFPGPLSRRPSRSTSRTTHSSAATCAASATPSRRLVTTRRGDGYHNDVAGIDGRFRISDQHEIRSSTCTPTRAIPKPRHSSSRSRSRTSPATLRGGLRVPAPRLGRRAFAQPVRRRVPRGLGLHTARRHGVQGLEGFRVWQRGGRPWNRIRAGVDAYTTHDESGRLLDEAVAAEVSFNGPLQSYIEVGGGPGKRFWDGQLYSLNGVGLFGQIRPRGGLNVQLNVSYGERSISRTRG